MFLPSFDLNPSAAEGGKKGSNQYFWSTQVHFAFKLKIETVLFGGIFVSPAHLIFDYQTRIFPACQAACRDDKMAPPPHRWLGANGLNCKTSLKPLKAQQLWSLKEEKKRYQLRSITVIINWVFQPTVCQKKITVGPRDTIGVIRSKSFFKHIWTQFRNKCWIVALSALNAVSAQCLRQDELLLGLIELYADDTMLSAPD